MKHYVIHELYYIFDAFLLPGEQIRALIWIHIQYYCHYLCLLHCWMLCTFCLHYWLPLPNWQWKIYKPLKWVIISPFSTVIVVCNASIIGMVHHNTIICSWKIIGHSYCFVPHFVPISLHLKQAEPKKNIMNKKIVIKKLY